MRWYDGREKKVTARSEAVEVRVVSGRCQSGRLRCDRVDETEECHGNEEVQAEMQMARLKFEFSKAVATRSASGSHHEAGAQAWNK